MKAVILAAGYAARLYPLTKDKAKPLLEVKGQPIIYHIIKKIEELPVSEVIIVTNDKFYNNFKQWLEANSFVIPVKILNDGTKSLEDKLGGIGDIRFTLKKEKINEDVLIVAGDNLFNFSLKKMHEFFKKKKAPVIGFYDVGWMEQAKKLGIVELDKNNKIIDFQEKPENPPSTLAATLIYMFPKSTSDKIADYLKEGNSPDAPGYFVKWLYKVEPVYGFVFYKKWFDIGSFEALEKAQKEFLTQEEPKEEKVEEEEEEEGFFGLKR